MKLVFLLESQDYETMFNFLDIIKTVNARKYKKEAEIEIAEIIDTIIVAGIPVEISLLMGKNAVSFPYDGFQGTNVSRYFNDYLKNEDGVFGLRD